MVPVVQMKCQPTPQNATASRERTRVSPKMFPHHTPGTDARALTPSQSMTPSRVRIEVVPSPTARVSPRRVLCPLRDGDTVLDVRERIASLIQEDGEHGECEGLRRRSSSAVRVRLSIDGFDLLDACRARDVVRETDVVVAHVDSPVNTTSPRGQSSAKLTSDEVGRMFLPLEPSNVCALHEKFADAEETREDGGCGANNANDVAVAEKRPSRSARRKSAKRAKRREASAVTDMTTTDTPGGDEAAEAPPPLDAPLEWPPAPLGDYPAKPKPRAAYKYKHIQETYVHDAEKLEALRKKREAAMLDEGATAWESRVFASEMSEEDIEQHPSASSLMAGDIIAYKVYLEDEDVWSPYYQGRVMRFEPDTGFVRLKPMPEDRVSAAGHLFFTLGEHAPKPFTKRGEYEGNFKDLREVRIIAGRSVWTGAVASKMWTPRTFTPNPAPPSWQPKQKESAEEYDAWLNEHRKIHAYQMAHAREWDEEIARGDREGRWKHRERDVDKYAPRSQKRRYQDDIHEDDDAAAFTWPTSAEELQATLQAEWDAAQGAMIQLGSPVKPGAPPPMIPGAMTTTTVESERQPSPPPGSPPSAQPNSQDNEKEPQRQEPPRTRARAKASPPMKVKKRGPRGSMATMLARLRDEGALESASNDD